MKTGVFKRMSYFAAALALAASGSIFVPGMVYADGCEATEITTETTEAVVCDGGALITAINSTVGTVKLGADIETSDMVTIASDRTVTLDLNGKTLTSITNGARKIANRGNLTITGNGTLTNGATSTGAYGLIDNYGVITIENGSFIDYGGGDGSTIKNRPNSNSVLTVKAGSFESKTEQTGNACIYSDGALTIYDGVSFKSASNRAYAVIVNSGTGTIGTTTTGASVIVDGTHGALGVNSGVVTVNNGVYSAKNYYALWITNNHEQSDVTVNGGTFNGARYGLYAAVDDGHQDEGDVGVVINGGEFNGGTKAAVAMNSTSSEQDWGIEISGGTYNTEIPTGYVKEGYAEYQLSEDGPWTVDAVSTMADESTVTVRVGETKGLGLDAVALKYATEAVSDEAKEHVSVANHQVTGVKAGETFVMVQLHDTAGTEKRVKLVVYEENNDDATLHTELDAEPATSEELVNKFGLEAVDALVSAVGSDNIAGYFDIEVKIVDQNENELGTVSETANLMKIEAEIPDNVPAVADGYARTWYFVYYHNGQQKRIEATEENGKAIAYSKEFSPYILAYVDTVATDTTTVTSASATLTSGTTTNPNTGDDVANYVALAWLGVAVMIGAVAYLMRQEA
ncbi:hypothetical protein IJ096_02195 [Candidatus Saccharibacteria bacterium]|nr:hypothetical protein [Candidatus Saccharibacteria bacterium]